MSRSEPAAGGHDARPALAGPDPTPEELAAIVAAIEVAWPRPSVLAEGVSRRTSWKWSGRWWAAQRPVAADRRRP